MSDTKDRLEKLLRLATNNPNDNEAAAAALKFCRMFVHVKAEIALPGERLPIPSPYLQTFTPPSPPSPEDLRSFDEFMRDYQKQRSANESWFTPPWAK